MVVFVAVFAATEVAVEARAEGAAALGAVVFPLLLFWCFPATSRPSRSRSPTDLFPLTAAEVSLFFGFVLVVIVVVCALLCGTSSSSSSSSSPVSVSMRRKTLLTISQDFRRLWGEIPSLLIVLYSIKSIFRTSSAATSMLIPADRLRVDEPLAAVSDGGSLPVRSRMSINKSRTKTGSSLLTSFSRRSTTLLKIVPRCSLLLLVWLWWSIVLVLWWRLDFDFKCLDFLWFPTWSLLLPLSCRIRFFAFRCDRDSSGRWFPIGIGGILHY